MLEFSMLEVDPSKPLGQVYTGTDSMDPDFEKALTGILSEIYLDHDGRIGWRESSKNNRGGKGIEGLVNGEPGMVFNKFIPLVVAQDGSSRLLMYRMYVSYFDQAGFGEDTTGSERNWYQVVGQVEPDGIGLKLTTKPLVTKVRNDRSVNTQFWRYTDQEKILELYPHIDPDYAPPKVN